MGPKPEAAKTELWISAAAALIAFAAAGSATLPISGRWFAGLCIVLVTMIYGMNHTRRWAFTPGWKTLGFWASAATMALCGAAVLATVPMVPVFVPKIAAVALASLTAMGYSVRRYNAKPTLGER